MRSLLVFLSLFLLFNAVSAGERVRLGKARVFTNDFIGDRQDRWRTGSYAVSYLKGPEWQGHLPTGFGDIVEYRFRSEIIAPSNLANPVIGTDRRYAGVLSFGMFTHFDRGGNDVSLGLDFVTTGPQTGMGDFHTWSHSVLGTTAPAVLGSQIGNGFYPTAVAEIGRDIEFKIASGSPVRLRPFIEARAGDEIYFRVGADLTIGQLGLGGLAVRDTVSGQRAADCWCSGGR